MAILALTLTAVGSAVAAYGYAVSDWGCPSTEEIERPLTAGEVTEAFSAAGFDLQPTRAPVTFWGGARLYARKMKGASIFVLIYPPGRTTPNQSDPVFQSLAGAQGVPYGIQLLNVDIGWTDAHLAKFVNPAVEDLNRSPRPGDRCYVG